MIEKKIFSDLPQHNKPPESNDGLLKNFEPKKEEPVKKEDPVKEEKKQEETKPEETKPVTQLPPEPDMKIAVFLTEVFGTEGFENLRKKGDFLVPFTDEQTDLLTWIAQSIRMLFNPAEAQSMGDGVDRWLKKQKTVFSLMEQDLEKMKLQVDEKDKLKKQAENDYLISDTERQNLKRELMSSVSAVYLVDLFLPKGKNTDADKIAGLLKEEMLHPGLSLPAFITGFMNGWPQFLDAFEKAEDTEAGMELLHHSLTVLLGKINGCAITQRRPILEIIAGMCSAKFKLYKFISPEESLQVDPRIHSATDLGGSTIREGISFAVIRKDTMQTVKYAEIKV
jgi:hypothetical protein